MPSFLPCCDGGEVRARRCCCTFALNGGGSITVSRWMMASVLSRMIEPTVVMPSPVARDRDGVGELALGGHGLRHARRRRVGAADEDRDRRRRAGLAVDVDRGRRDRDPCRAAAR